MGLSNWAQGFSEVMSNEIVIGLIIILFIGYMIITAIKHKLEIKTRY